MTSWNLFYQSHHTGIEMPQISIFWIFNVDYQSHHTGIEIVALYFQWCHILLPIAPYWNWNPQTGLMPGAEPATNRTILELKFCREWKEFRNGFSLPIAPYWNWNTKSSSGCSGKSVCYQSHHTGIEISDFMLLPYTILILPIAPYWNWNVDSALDLGV